MAFGPVSGKFKNIDLKRFLDFIALSWIYGMDLRFCQVYIFHQKRERERKIDLRKEDLFFKHSRW
jgi:hypothetical protein